MICDKCKKIDVCKYTQQIKEFEKNIKKDGLPEVIEVKYSCIHKDNVQIFRRNRRIKYE